MKKFLFLIPLLLLVFAGTLTFVSSGASTPTSSRELVILQTTDLHGNTGFNGRPGSLFGVAKVIDSVRVTTPDTMLLLIDCGDFSYGTIESTFSNVEFPMQWMRKMRYDAVVIGNHEFDGGYDNLKRMIDSAPGVVLAANLEVEGTTNIRRWKLFERNGLKIAVFGLVTQETPKYIYGFERDSRIRLNGDLPAVAASVIDEISRVKPDLIVMACHAGRHTPGFDILKIIRRHPQIQLVLGGHSHVRANGETVGRGTAYLQAGSHGTHVGIARVTFPSTSRATPFMRTELVETPEVTHSEKLADSAYAQLDADLNCAIGYCPTRYLGSPERTNDLIHGLLEIRYGILCSLLGGSRYTLADTEIKAWMPCAVSPYEDRLVTLELTDSELSATLKECNALPVGSRPRLRNWTAGSAVRIPVITTSYYAAGAGGRLPTLEHAAKQPEAKTNILPHRIRDEITDYFKLDWETL